MTKKIIFYLVIISSSLFAQLSEFEIMPHHISFVDKFERIKRVRMINKGTSEVKIDSVSYDLSMLHIRNNNFTSFPLVLTPDSSISIDVLLNSYFNLNNNDSTTVISIYIDGTNTPRNINVSVYFQMLREMDGTIQGSVKDSSNYIEGAKIYFFFAGIYLVDSTSTDANGNYEKQLRSGNYFVAAQKDGYYMQYGYLKNSNLEADFIEVRKDIPNTVDFILEAEMQTNLSVSGVVYDILNDVVLNKAIVVVRKGDHDPTKIQASSLIDISRDYAVMTNSKGEYNIRNIQAGGGYYIQAFSQFYIPGYFNEMKMHETNWQNANSINVFGGETGKDIYLDRDSSYGGGVAKGRVRQNIAQPDSTKNALIYAISTSNNKAYTYSFSNTSGDFGLRDLPSGNYKLVTDKIGYNSSISNDFYIGSTQDTILNIDLILLPTSVKQINQIISTFSLLQNYPNPFNPSTVIKYQIPNDGLVTLRIYDVKGQVIKTLVNQTQAKGRYAINFDASNLSTGVYFYRLISGSFTKTMKMLLIK